MISEEYEMTKFNDNEATMMALDETFDIDYNAEEVLDRGGSYLEALAKSNFFLDAVKNYIKKGTSSFSGDIENIDDVLNFIKKGYENASVKGSTSLINKWLTGETIPRQEKTLQLALCLGMSVEEASEFIFKASLSRPFNFKNIYDSVCYFCLEKGKSFVDAQRIIEEIEKTEAKAENAPDNDTIVIGERVKSAQTEEELIQYLSSNKSGFVNQNQTALKVLKELVNEFVELNKSKYNNITANDIPAILNIMLGYEARAKIDGVEVYKKKIDKSDFPNLIKTNFPQPQQLQDIINGKSSSSEGIRKAIILFTFYNLFTKLQKEGIQANGFELYADIIDETLYKSGYMQMYWKHPYDWMFGYCAGADDPIDEFRELISAFYLDKEDIYSTENQFDKE